MNKEKKRKRWEKNVLTSFQGNRETPIPLSISVLSRKRSKENELFDPYLLIVIRVLILTGQLEEEFGDQTTTRGMITQRGESIKVRQPIEQKSLLLNAHRHGYRLKGKRSSQRRGQGKGGNTKQCLPWVLVVLDHA